MFSVSSEEHNIFDNSKYIKKIEQLVSSIVEFPKFQTFVSSCQSLYLILPCLTIIIAIGTYKKYLEKRRDLKFIHLEFLFLQPFLLMFHSQIAFILLTYLQEKKSIHNKKNTILRLFYIHSNLFHLKIAKAAAPGGRGGEGGEERGRRGKIGEGGGNL